MHALTHTSAEQWWRFIPIEEIELLREVDGFHSSSSCAWARAPAEKWLTPAAEIFTMLQHPTVGHRHMEWPSAIAIKRQHSIGRSMRDEISGSCKL
jgi:hypothetical protein